uniref:Uncharacterized protein n=1 Tax=Chromera velia CCMP2878 TaxID=1169474 RepID=A0A0G4HIM6_9ALVE|eukprot:Cvel_27839.t1-p1 / transcript=Cvel_27839.t1 / gene=Cvel_27839 / organism=Chromera_velia_CCMP2878 / gene_product=hypothetical protein / transcript_product=hypothetical protein / location=Cvel_scaffold3540:8870-12863(-) / protein_length=419 / sequence_SO=supercontig / SO=protein_coding / is_pseudo=false
MTTAERTALEEKIHGKEGENEQIRLQMIPLRQLWRRTTDSKAMIASGLYRELDRDRRLPRIPYPRPERPPRAEGGGAKKTAGEGVPPEASGEGEGTKKPIDGTTGGAGRERDPAAEEERRKQRREREKERQKQKKERRAAAQAAEKEKKAAEKAEKEKGPQKEYQVKGQERGGGRGAERGGRGGRGGRGDRERGGDRDRDRAPREREEPQDDAVIINEGVETHTFKGKSNAVADLQPLQEHVFLRCAVATNPKPPKGGGRTLERVIIAGDASGVIEILLPGIRTKRIRFIRKDSQITLKSAQVTMNNNHMQLTVQNWEQLYIDPNPGQRPIVANMDNNVSETEYELVEVPVEPQPATGGGGGGGGGRGPGEGGGRGGGRRGGGGGRGGGPRGGGGYGGGGGPRRGGGGRGRGGGGRGRY